MVALDWMRSLDQSLCPVYSIYVLMMECVEFEKNVPQSMKKLASLLTEDAQELFDQLYIEKAGIVSNGFFCDRAYRRMNSSINYIDELSEELGEMKGRWYEMKTHFQGISQRMLEIDFIL